MTILRRGTVALVAMLTLLVGTAARAQVASQIPSDALVVIKVKSLSGTSAKIGAYLGQLGVAAMVPQAADPLGALQQELGINAGLDKQGEAALVMVDPERAGGNPDQAVLVLLPVSDYAAFLSNFADAKTDGDVTEAKMGTEQETTYFAHWGNYAAMSPNKALVSQKPSMTLKVAGIAAREMDGRDIVMFANFPAIKTKLLPELEKNRGEMLAEMERELGNQPELAQFAPAIRAGVNQFLNMAQAFIRDTEAATMGLSIANEGLSIAVVSEFGANTYLGGVAGSLKNSNAPMLVGLPAGKYLMYGGTSSNPATMNKLFDDVVQPVLAELAKVDAAQAKAINDYAMSIRGMIAAVDSNSWAMLAPSGMIGQDAVIQVIYSLQGDSNAVMKSMSDMTKASQGFMGAMGMGDGMKMTETANAKTIAGVNFNMIKTDFDPNSNDPNAMQMQQMMQMMYGPNGATTYMGAVDGKNVLMFIGVSDPTVEKAVAALKAGQAPLEMSDTVKSVTANLPKDRLAVFFVPVADIATTVLEYANQLMGQRIPVQLPPDLPPIGMTFSSEGTALRSDVYVPTSLVQSLVAAGLQAAAQMQGGGRGGGL